MLECREHATKGLPLQLGDVTLGNRRAWAYRIHDHPHLVVNKRKW